MGCPGASLVPYANQKPVTFKPLIDATRFDGLSRFRRVSYPLGKGDANMAGAFGVFDIPSVCRGGLAVDYALNFLAL